MEKGDRLGAPAALCRADERGHADAAALMAEVPREAGDRKGAKAAARRAKERGCAGWAD